MENQYPISSQHAPPPPRPTQTSIDVQVERLFGDARRAAYAETPFPIIIKNKEGKELRLDQDFFNRLQDAGQETQQSNPEALASLKNELYELLGDENANRLLMSYSQSYLGYEMFSYMALNLSASTPAFYDRGLGSLTFNQEKVKASIVISVSEDDTIIADIKMNNLMIGFGKNDPNQQTLPGNPSFDYQIISKPDGSLNYGSTIVCSDQRITPLFQRPLIQAELCSIYPDLNTYIRKKNLLALRTPGTAKTNNIKSLFKAIDCKNLRMALGLEASKAPKQDDLGKIIEDTRKMPLSQITDQHWALLNAIVDLNAAFDPKGMFSKNYEKSSDYLFSENNANLNNLKAFLSINLPADQTLSSTDLKSLLLEVIKKNPTPVNLALVSAIIYYYNMEAGAADFDSLCLNIQNLIKLYKLDNTTEAKALLNGMQIADWSKVQKTDTPLAGTYATNPEGYTFLSEIQAPDAQKGASFFWRDAASNAQSEPFICNGEELTSKWNAFLSDPMRAQDQENSDTLSRQLKERFPKGNWDNFLSQYSQDVIGSGIAGPLNRYVREYDLLFNITDASQQVILSIADNGNIIAKVKHSNLLISNTTDASKTPIVGDFSYTVEFRADGAVVSPIQFSNTSLRDMFEGTLLPSDLLKANPKFREKIFANLNVALTKITSDKAYFDLPELYNLRIMLGLPAAKNPQKDTLNAVLQDALQGKPSDACIDFASIIINFYKQNADAREHQKFAAEIQQLLKKHNLNSKFPDMSRSLSQKVIFVSNQKTLYLYQRIGTGLLRWRNNLAAFLSDAIRLNAYIPSFIKNYLVKPLTDDQIANAAIEEALKTNPDWDRVGDLLSLSKNLNLVATNDKQWGFLYHNTRYILQLAHLAEARGDMPAFIRLAKLINIKKVELSPEEIQAFNLNTPEKRAAYRIAYNFEDRALRNKNNIKLRNAANAMLKRAGLKQLTEDEIIDFNLNSIEARFQYRLNLLKPPQQPKKSFIHERKEGPDENDELNIIDETQQEKYEEALQAEIAALKAEYTNAENHVVLRKKANELAHKLGLRSVEDQQRVFMKEVYDKMPEKPKDLDDYVAEIAKSLFALMGISKQSATAAPTGTALPLPHIEPSPNTTLSQYSKLNKN